MRVVCDNCGAVYKISSAKLVKEVNRATCKRCGHKILITKPGSNSAAEADTGARQGGSEADQVVVRSSPDLGGAPQPSVPSIGSLTAELRAITIPGIDSVGGKASGAAARLGPGASEPDSELTERRDLGTPLVAPAVGIPASNSPATMAYGGPRPAVSAAAPAVEPATGGAASPLAASGMVSARHATVPAGSSAKPATQSSAATAGAPPGAAAVLKVVASFAGLGVIGMICTILLGGWAAVAAVALAGIGLGSSFALATITDYGAKPQRIPLALFLGVVCGIGMSVPAVLDLNSADSAPQTATVVPAEVPVPEVAEAVDPATSEVATEEPVTGAVVDGASSGAEGLSEAELEEARRFESAQDSTRTNEPAPRSAAPEASTPSKGSKADVDPAAEAEKAAAAARAEDKRKVDAERRQERRREEAERREEADQRAAERRAEEKRRTGLGGPARASLKKPNSGQPRSTKSSGPKPFVIDTIIRNNGNIKRCLEAEQARGQDLSGKIFLQFTISPDGGVSRAKLTTSRWAGTSLDTCISKHVNRLDFPPFDGKAKKIKYALVIQ